MGRGHSSSQCRIDGVPGLRQQGQCRIDGGQDCVDKGNKKNGGFLHVSEGNTGSAEGRRIRGTFQLVSVSAFRFSYGA